MRSGVDVLTPQQLSRECLWGFSLQVMLNTFPPDLSYVASSRLLTRLRKMRSMIPLQDDTSVLWSYWNTIMEVITTNIVIHEGDRPEFVNVLDNNRIFVWAERVSFRVYCTLDCYSGCFTGWNLPNEWPTGEARFRCERVLFGDPFEPANLEPPSSQSHYRLMHIGRPLGYSQVTRGSSLSSSCP